MNSIVRKRPKTDNLQNSAITKKIKEELVKLQESDIASKKVELLAILRFAGSLHIISRQIVIEVELDSLALTDRVQKLLIDVFNCKSELIIYKSGSLQKEEKYLVRIAENGSRVAVHTGLINRNGQLTYGLQKELVLTPNNKVHLALRGAFFARGSLSNISRSPSIEITCPGEQTGIGLSGLIRRSGILTKVRQVRSSYKVGIRTSKSIAKFLYTIGANEMCREYLEQNNEQNIKSGVQRFENFDTSNLRRSAQAAVVTACRVRRAFELLDKDSVPSHIWGVGELRLKHKDCSLDELGKISTPPISKDAIAGRLRRLLKFADKKAKELGVPNTLEHYNLSSGRQFTGIDI
jgi:DNA-binding protein WhiA